MELLVVLWSYGILKVVDPTPSQPLYILYAPECRLADGAITVKSTGPRSTEGDVIEGRELEGTLSQGDQTCDVEELVYPGP